MISSLVVYDVHHMNTETLIQCSSNDGWVIIPSSICKFYMFNFREPKPDVDVINKSIGISYILNGENEGKYEISSFYIENGADVNAINGVGFYKNTALHSAIIVDDLMAVKYLLNNNARVDVYSPSMKMTALELSKSLNNVNSDEINNLLQSAITM